MRIAVMGAGGVGGYFGGRLAAAGNDVHFIARGAHLAALRAPGLRLISPDGDLGPLPVPASDDPTAIGPVDLVMFATKLFDTEAAGALIRPLVGPDTAVISFLNGIDSEDRLASILGPDAIVGGVAEISARIVEPGVIRRVSPFCALSFGERDGRDSPRLDRFLRLCQAAGIEARHVHDITRAIWRKFAFLASLAAVNGLTRLSVGQIRRSPPAWDLVYQAIDEVLAVAAAKGIDLGADARIAVRGIVDGLPDPIKASLLGDLEAGNRLEIEDLSGAVARLGAELGVDVPVHRIAAAALHPFAAGRPD